MLFNNKKANGAALVLIIILIIIIIVWLIGLTGRECENNNDCPKDHYCGSDFKCHQFPLIEREVVKNNLLWPSFIIGAAIVVSAVILKYKRKEVPQV